MPMLVLLLPAVSCGARLLPQLSSAFVSRRASGRLGTYTIASVHTGSSEVRVGSNACGQPLNAATTGVPTVFGLRAHEAWFGRVTASRPASGANRTACRAASMRSGEVGTNQHL
eukprot:6181102-Pleurochrysis_carterae.AAC.5